MIALKSKNVSTGPKMYILITILTKGFQEINYTRKLERKGEGRGGKINDSL